MKTADELFTELDYYKYEFENYIDYSDTKIGCGYGTVIRFHKNSKTFEKFEYDEFDNYGDIPNPISIQELKAINKFFEERGWRNK